MGAVLSPVPPEGDGPSDQGTETVPSLAPKEVFLLGSEKGGPFLRTCNRLGVSEVLLCTTCTPRGSAVRDHTDIISGLRCPQGSWWQQVRWGCCAGLCSQRFPLTRSE